MFLEELKYEYKAVNLLKGEQFSPGEEILSHVNKQLHGYLSASTERVNLHDSNEQINTYFKIGVVGTHCSATVKDVLMMYPWHHQIWGGYMQNTY